ncbi:hypothetical protein [Alicyclobacillus sp.]|uniref:hypothetical protein n=1 Tax=Alicyclobacillus sp. TaxID=61169 RepID=UPI0025BBE930|nr:hypothetical protein [Alicyclobacillus sp.]MCL6515462.1 hypothetical protein [Alicyclobacillus sp.]
MSIEGWVYRRGLSVAVAAAALCAAGWALSAHAVPRGASPPSGTVRAPAGADGVGAVMASGRSRADQASPGSAEGDADDPLPNGPPVLTWTSDGVRYRAVHHVARWNPATGRWEPISPDVTEAWQPGEDGFGVDGITAVAQAGEVLWTGTLAGAVAIGQPGGVWRRVDDGLPARTVSAIAPAPGADGARMAVVAFAGYGSATPGQPGHVFLTTDAGGTWRDLTGNLPDAPVTAARWTPTPDGPRLSVAEGEVWYTMAQPGRWSRDGHP